MKSRCILTSLSVAFLVASAGQAGAAADAAGAHIVGKSLYTYTLAQDGTPESYDEALAVACLQGIINRKEPVLYVLSRNDPHPAYWLDLLSKEGRWLQGRPPEALTNLDALVQLAGNERSRPQAQADEQTAVANILALQKRVKPDPEGWTSRDYINYGRR